MNKLIKVAGVGLGLALAFPAIAPAFAATGVPFTDSAVTNIKVSGSDTTYPLMNQLAVAYMESDGCLLTPASFPLTAASLTQNRCQATATSAPLAGDNTFENYDHDVIVNYFPQGSNVGRGQLCNQNAARDARIPYIDVARSSSAPTTGFQCTVANGGQSGVVLRFVAFARDAISWTHWSTATGGGGAVTDLTVAQLKGIFVDCTITDWGQVGGVAGQLIVPFTSIPGSGTRSTWDSFIGGNTSTCIPAQFKDGSFANGERLLREHQMEPVEAALNDPAAADEGNSIYYMSVGLYNSKPGNRASSLLGNVNTVVPNEANIVSGAFPFSRNMYNVYRNSGATPTASGAVRRFTGMINSTATNGQSIGWICKAEANHSEQIGNPSAGTEVPTANQDWYEIKKAAFASSGMFQLAPDAFGNRCTFSDHLVP